MLRSNSANGDVFPKRIMISSLWLTSLTISQLQANTSFFYSKALFIDVEVAYFWESIPRRVAPTASAIHCWMEPNVLQRRYESPVDPVPRGA